MRRMIKGITYLDLYQKAESLLNRGEITIGEYEEMIEPLKEIILPSADRPKGEWIDTGSGQECDQCHEIQYGYDSHRNFCPNCGSYNRGGKDDA